MASTRGTTAASKNARFAAGDLVVGGGNRFSSLIFDDVDRQVISTRVLSRGLVLGCYVEHIGIMMLFIIDSLSGAPGWVVESSVKRLFSHEAAA